MEDLLVIDLLNKIVKGEKVPKEIMINDKHFIFNENEEMYNYVYKGSIEKVEFYTDNMIFGYVDLTDSVHIIDNQYELQRLREFVKNINTGGCEYCEELKGKMLLYLGDEDE